MVEDFAYYIILYEELKYNLANILFLRDPNYYSFFIFIFFC